MIYNNILKFDESVDIIQTEFFTNVVFNENKVPQHFWKIHVSSKLETFSVLLNIVGEYLIKKRINFKYVRSSEIAFDFLSIKTSSSQIGKLITIYPSNLEEARQILQSLEKLTRGFHGPEILTDRSYKESEVVHYRYGLNIRTEENTITGPLGEKFVDDRKNEFNLPEWITDPFQDSVYQTGTKIQTKYNLLGIIMKTPAGNTYLAEINDKKYVIKEARKYIFSGEHALKADLKNNEFEYAKALEKYGGINVIKGVEIVEEVYSVFFVYEHLDGGDLSRFPSTVSPILSNKMKYLRIDNIKNLFVELLKTVVNIHSADIKNLDIRDSNLSWIDNKIYFLDLDSFDSGNSKNYTKTHGYWLNEFKTKDAKVQDFRRIGMLFLFMIGDLNFVLAAHNNKNQIIIQLYQLLFINEINPYVAEFVPYLLCDKKPKGKVAVNKLKKLPFKNYESAKELRAFILNQFRKFNDKQDINDNGYTEIGVSVNNYLKSNLLTVKDANKFIEVLKNLEIRDESEDKLYLKMNPDKRAKISPYISDGGAGAVLYLIKLYESGLTQKNIVEKYADMLSFNFSKSPSLWSGLLGIAFTNIELFRVFQDVKYLELANTQIITSLNYISYSDNKFGFFDFYSNSIKSGHKYGVDGLYLIIEYYFKIKEEHAI
ncbi:MAG: hypothetical protein LBT37_05675 [Lactobacillaceae bacterium]|jgi:serine/threonine protein kinase|nr:hypothetical protein [Lactobacillaceae bacterium]